MLSIIKMTDIEIPTEIGHQTWVVLQLMNIHKT